MEPINKRKPPLLLLVLLNVVLLSLGHALNNRVLLLFALVLFAVLAVFSPKADFLPILLFYQPWSPVLKLTPNTFTMASLVIPVVLIMIMLEKDQRKLKYNIGLALLFTAYTLLVKLLNGLSLQTPYIFFIIMMFFVPVYLKKYKSEISFEKCTLFLTAGTLSSCISAQILLDYPHMQEYIDVIYAENTGLTRISGFIGDPNQYSSLILVTIAALLIVLSKSRKKSLIFFEIGSIVALVYFGLLSVSKTFLLSLALLAVLWMFSLIIEKRISYKVGMIVAVIVIVGITVSNNLFTEQIEYYTIRFGAVSDTSSLTTGRSVLWGVYLDYLLSHADKLMFGIGLSKNQIGVLLNKNDVHFTLLQIIYQLGVIGGFILIMWWRGVYQGLVNKVKLTFSQAVYFLILAVAVLLPWFALDMLYAKEFFYFILLLFLAKNYLTSKPDVNLKIYDETAIPKDTRSKGV